MKTLIFVVGMIMMTAAVHLHRKSTRKRVITEPQNSMAFWNPFFAKRRRRSSYCEHKRTLVYDPISRDAKSS